MGFMEKEVMLIIYVAIIILIVLIFLYFKVKKKRKIEKKEENLIEEIKNILNSSNPENKIYKLIEQEKKKIDLVNKDVKKALSIMDDLLGKLPEEEIEKFAKSKDFELYQKVLTKFEIGDVAGE